MNDYFTKFADLVSEQGGKWYVSIFAVLCLFAWIAIGPHYGWNNTWQLIANTPTTWIELFLGLLMLASANRIEKRNWELHLQMKEMLETIESMVQKEEEEVEQLLKK